MYRLTSSRSIFAFGTAVVLIVCNALSAEHRGPKPALDPSQGDGGVSAFYVWGKEVPSTPGRLLRQEPLPENLLLANSSKGMRVLYTSTNGIDGVTPITVSGALYLPKGSVPKGGWPTLAWAHGTTGVADVCAPSWAPRSKRDTDYLNAWLEQGYAIIATDYQGLGTPGGHPWLTVRPEGWSVLDSVRAGLKAFPQLANSVVIVGQSQGAHAALSAALLAGDYAPDLRIRGTVATGVPGSLSFAPETNAPQISVPPSRDAYAPVLLLYTFMALYPRFNASDYLSDAAKPVFQSARTACGPEIIQIAERGHVTVMNALKKSSAEVASKAALYQRYPPPRFAKPIFIGAGLADKAVFPEGEYNFAMAACYAGSTVEFHYYPGRDHSGTVNASLVHSVPFVKRILAGQSISSNCTSLKPPLSEN